MVVLAIGAHPDDIEYGCGGTLVTYQQQGHPIYFLVLTTGERGGDPAVRQREQMAAAGLLHVKQVFWGGYADTELPVTRELIGKIEEVVQATRPSVVLVNYLDDTHQDHRNLARAVASATRYVRNVLYYEGPTTSNFVPPVFVDIAAVMQTKLAALEAHTSQICETNIEGASILDLARATATFRGVQGRVTLAEGFMPLRLFLPSSSHGRV